MKTAVNIKSQFCLLLVLLFTYQSFAKVVVSPSVTLTSSTLVTGGKVACYADIMNAYAGTLGSYSPLWPGPGSNASAINAKINAVDILKSGANIKLRVKDLNKYPNLCFPDNFTYTVNIKYKKLSTNGTYDATEQSAQLTVSYSKTKGQQYKNLDIVKIDDAVFFSAYIESISSSNSQLSIKDFVELNAELEYDYLTKPTLFSAGAAINGGSIEVSSGTFIAPEILYFTPKVSASYDTDNEHILIKAAVRSDADISSISGNSAFTAYWTAQKDNFTNWIDSVEIQWNFSEDQYFEYASSQFKEKEITSTTVTYIPQYNQYAISVVVPYNATATADYILSNIFEKGVLSVRARFLGRIAVRNSGGSITEVRMIQCPWSDFFGGAQVYNSGGTASLGQSLALKIATYSPKLNWIFNCTYAEDGKKKEVINYFDGTLKSRQVITTSNTDDFALVKETIYDYQGRPAIEVLPVPTTPNSLKYVPNFNQSVNGTSVAYSATDFDFNTSNCGTTTLGMDPTSGAAKYYSSNNAWLTGAVINSKHQFIPSSGNSTDGFYPFVQTIYTPDNTGRISISAQPGVDFRLNSQKETRYFYGRPEQEELDRLFGAEVGFASHYTKEMVRDANGQFSVSIKDLSGKVIVTALAGDNGAGTNALSSASQTQDIDVDLLEHSQTKLDDGYLLSSPILVAKSQTYKFQYTLTPATYSKLCNGSEFYCLDCIYNLEISITDECGTQYLKGDQGSNDLKPITRKIGPSTINDECNTGESGYSTNGDGLLQNTGGAGVAYVTITLPAGKYTVSRKITVDQDARETYLREIVPNKLCKTLAEFEAEEAAKINLEQCRPCEAYNIARKQGGDIRQNYVTNVYTSRFHAADELHAPDASTVTTRTTLIGEEYDVAKERCGIKVSPCVTYREIMLNDVYPDGLYGDMSTSTGGNYSVFKTNANASLWYKGVAYFDDINNGIIVGSGTTVTKLKDLSLSDLKKYWKREYAEALVHLHPEYYQYQACSDLAESKTYDVEFNSTLDFADANSFHYMDYTGPGSGNNADPFVLNSNGKLSSTIVTDFTDKINTDAANALGLTIPGMSGSISLKQVAAWLIFCKDANATNAPTCISNAVANVATCDYRSKSLFWNTYKALYQSIKTKVYNDYAYSIRNTTTYANRDASNMRFEAPLANQTNVNTGKANTLAKMDEQCKKACENMADGWINKLSECAFSSDPTTREAQITALKQALVSVCKEGCDDKNPLGASTVKPGSTNQYKSFEDVFIQLGYAYTPKCNAGLITFPKPYSTNGNLTGEGWPLAALQKDFCGGEINPCVLFGNCNQTISTADLSACSLLNTANNSDISKLISSVDTMTCQSGNCISCSKFRELNQKYFNTSASYKATVSLTAFINTELDFNLTESDYINFMVKCLGYTTNPYSNTADLIADYNQSYLIYKATTMSDGSGNNAIKTYTVASIYNWQPIHENGNPYYMQKAPNTMMAKYTMPSYTLNQNILSASTSGGAVFYTNNKEKGFKNFAMSPATNDEPKDYSQLTYIDETICKTIEAYYNDYINLEPPYSGNFMSYLQNVRDVTNISDADSIRALCNETFKLEFAADLAESGEGTVPTIQLRNLTEEDAFSTTQKVYLLSKAVALDLTAPKEMGSGENSSYASQMPPPTGEPNPSLSYCDALYAIIGHDANGNAITNFAPFVANYDAREATANIIFSKLYLYPALKTYLETQKIYSASDLSYYLKTLLCSCSLLSSTVCAAEVPLPCAPCKCFKDELDAFKIAQNTNEQKLLTTDASTKLISFYNIIKTKFSAPHPFIQFANGRATEPHNIKQWLKDILCTCKLSTDYCPDNTSKCGGSSISSNCFLPNKNVLALQAVLQAVTTSSVNGLNPWASSIRGVYYCCNYFTGTQAPFMTLFNLNFTGAAAGCNTAVFSYNGAGQYAKGVTRQYDAELWSVPNCASPVGPKRLAMSMILEDAGLPIYFSSIDSIFELLPEYLPGTYTATNRFSFKARVHYSLPYQLSNGTYITKNYSRIVLVTGSYEDVLTRSVTCEIKCAKLCKAPQAKVEPCEVTLQNTARASAWYNYNNYKKAVIEEERANYNKKCLDALKTNETFVKKYTDNQYHYTLYYYDAAGNLVRTVPPQGVNPLNPTNTKAIHTERKKEYANYYHVENPDPGYTPVTIASTVDVTHTFTTNYKYNTLNQLIWQNTPDAGISQFGYDRVGRLVLSQNAKQYAKTPQSHSYTNYDALGRIVEVGELVNTSLNSIYGSASTLESPGFVQSDIVGQTNKKEITRTYYDNDPDASGAVNLRSRVAKVAFFNAYPTTSSIKPSHAVSYTYDIQGNVKQIKRYIQSLEIVNQSTKTVDYDFDVISGKVENVYYQNGKVDQYIHHYKYDAENRLVSSYSAPRQELIDATNNAGFDNIGLDAAYQYYYHGPLARTELGELKVQGLDYAYTLQGWLKGVNSSSLKTIDDMGKDAYTAETTNVNKTVPKDEMGFILNYHDKDYTQVQQNSSALAYTNKFNGDIISTNAGFSGFAKQLYNGNISSMVTAIGELISGTAGNALVSAYQYDQLNRIAEAKYFYKDATNALVSTTNWNNQFTYDANGNILTQFRNGAGTTVAMDNLKYYYYGYNTTTNTTYQFTYSSTGAIVDRSGSAITSIDRFTNQLASVKDAVSATNYTDDIDEQSNSDNYQYDAIGNLVKDKAEEIDVIEWNIYGKIKKITRTSSSTKPNLEFEYTPDGHRAVKIVIPANTAAPRIYTYYMRDAQGNILATYEREFNKTVDFEQLTYSNVNAKLITKSGTTAFANFIANQHGTNTALKNALESNIIGNSGKRTSLLDNSDLVALLNGGDNTASANLIINAYEDWTFLQAMAQYNRVEAWQILNEKLDARYQYNNSYNDLPTIIVNNEVTLKKFFTKFKEFNESFYNLVIKDFGIDPSNTEAEITQLSEIFNAEGPTRIINALMANDAWYLYGYPGSDILNDLLTYDSEFRNTLISNIPEFKRLFSLGVSGSYTNTASGQLSLASTINALNSFNSSLLNTTTRQNFIGGENAMVAWYKNNQAYAFIYQSVIIDYAPVTTFQAANNTLYNSTGVGNGIKQYFAAFQPFYGQSIVDQMLNEYLATSNLYVDKLKVNEWHMYGSSRLGIYKANITVVSKAVHITGTVNEGNVNVTEYSTLDEEPVLDNIHIAQTRGAKNYELSNHLGNVLVVVSDKKKYNCGGQSLIEANFDAGSYNNIFPVSNVSGMSLSGNKLNVTCTATNAQVGSLFDVEGAAGKTYQVDFDVTKSSSTSQVWFQATASYNSPGGGVNQYTGFATSNGHYTFTFTAPQGMYRYKFGADNSGSGTFTIDNFIVKSVEDGAYEAEVLNAQDYSPFGAPMATRNKQVSSVLVAKTVSQSSFSSGVDGWVPSGSATLINVYGNVRAVTTAINSGMKKVFSTEPGKTYRIKFKINLRGWPYMYVKDVATTNTIFSVTDFLSPNNYAYTITATGYQTQVEFLEVDKAVSELQLASFTLEEVEAENGYRFGFNGQEKDDEVSGVGNTMSAEYWEYDSRLGRRWNIDPVVKSNESPYFTFGGSPILNIDPKGNDWFVNKVTGNVVFLKGQSTIPKKYGNNNNWENLGKDNMFDKNGKNYTKNKSELYLDNKSAESFMKQQGYVRGHRMVIVRTTYYDKSAEGVPGESITTTIPDPKIIIQSTNITYVTPDKIDKEVTLNSTTEVMTTGVLTKTTETNVVVLRADNQVEKNYTSSDSYKGFLKYAAEKAGQVIYKIFKKK